jgi:hypothetical protein
LDFAFGFTFIPYLAGFPKAKLLADMVFDFSDFDKIIKPKKFKAWRILENVDKKISRGDSTSTIYILTARSSGIVDEMEKFFSDNGIKNINRDNIFAIGDKGGAKTISEKKKEVFSS